KLKQGRQPTPHHRMPPYPQEPSLKKEPQPDRKQNESHRTKHPGAQLNNRLHHCCEKANCRSDEEIATHRGQLILDRRPVAILCKIAVLVLICSADASIADKLD